MATNVHRVIYRGKKHTFLMTFLNAAGAAQDLTGAEIWLTAKTTNADADSALVFDLSTADGRIVVRNPATAGLADVTFLADDTDEITEWTLLAYDVQIKPSGGEPYVVESGVIEIRMPTKRGNT